MLHEKGWRLERQGKEEDEKQAAHTVVPLTSYALPLFLWMTAKKMWFKLDYLIRLIRL